MPKPKGVRHVGKLKKHTEDMPNVKIKRVKRVKKKPTTGEKVLGAVGLASTLLGGVSPITSKSGSSQIVRTQTSDSGSSTSKVRDTLQRLFGISEAKAYGSVADAQAQLDIASQDLARFNEWAAQAEADLSAGYFGQPGDASYDERSQAIQQERATTGGQLQQAVADAQAALAEAKAGESGTAAISPTPTTAISNTPTDTTTVTVAPPPTSLTNTGMSSGTGATEGQTRSTAGYTEVYYMGNWIPANGQTVDGSKIGRTPGVSYGSEGGNWILLDGQTIDGGKIGMESGVNYGSLSGQWVLLDNQTSANHPNQVSSGGTWVELTSETHLPSVGEVSPDGSARWDGTYWVPIQTSAPSYPVNIQPVAAPTTPAPVQPDIGSSGYSITAILSSSSASEVDAAAATEIARIDAWENSSVDTLQYWKGEFEIWANSNIPDAQNRLAMIQSAQQTVDSLVQNIHTTAAEQRQLVTQAAEQKTGELAGGGTVVTGGSVTTDSTPYTVYEATTPLGGSGKALASYVGTDSSGKVLNTVVYIVAGFDGNGTMTPRAVDESGNPVALSQETIDAIIANGTPGFLTSAPAPAPTPEPAPPVQSPIVITFDNLQVPPVTTTVTSPPVVIKNADGTYTVKYGSTTFTGSSLQELQTQLQRSYLNFLSQGAGSGIDTTAYNAMLEAVVVKASGVTVSPTGGVLGAEYEQGGVRITKDSSGNYQIQILTNDQVTNPQTKQTAFNLILTGKTTAELEAAIKQALSTTTNELVRNQLTNALYDLSLFTTQEKTGQLQFTYLANPTATLQTGTNSLSTSQQNFVYYPTKESAEAVAAILKNAGLTGAMVTPVAFGNLTQYTITFPGSTYQGNAGLIANLMQTGGVDAAVNMVRTELAEASGNYSTYYVGVNGGAPVVAAPAQYTKTTNSDGSFTVTLGTTTITAKTLEDFNKQIAAYQSNPELYNKLQSVSTQLQFQNFNPTFYDNAGITLPSGTFYDNSSTHFATYETAVQVAKLLGGQVSVAAGFGFSAPQYVITFPGSSTPINAGLVSIMLKTYGLAATLQSVQLEVQAGSGKSALPFIRAATGNFQQDLQPPTSQEAIQAAKSYTGLQIYTSAAATNLSGALSTAPTSTTVRRGTVTGSPLAASGSITQPTQPLTVVSSGTGLTPITPAGQSAAGDVLEVEDLQGEQLESAGTEQDSEVLDDLDAEEVPGGAGGGSASSPPIILSQQDRTAIDQLTRQVTGLQNRIDGLSSSLSNASTSAELRAANTQITALQGEIRRLQQTINTLNTAGSVRAAATEIERAFSPGLQMPSGYPASQGYPAEQQPAADAASTHTVKKGDTLWAIAKKYYGDGRKWRKVLEANTKNVKSPKTLQIGTVLVLPKL